MEVVRDHNALIVLEDLNKLKNRADGSRRFNKKLPLWTYRRIQSYIHYKALTEGLHAAYVNPRGTSKDSPIGGKLSFVNYRWVKLPNGHIVTRDVTASWNLALRGLKLITRDVGLCGSVEAPKAPEGDEVPNPMRGKPVPKLISRAQVPEISKLMSTGNHHIC